MLSAASHGTDHLIVQRLLATRSLRAARVALVGSGVVVFFQFLLFLLVGTAIWAAGLAPRDARRRRDLHPVRHRAPARRPRGARHRGHPGGGDGHTARPSTRSRPRSPTTSTPAGPDDRSQSHLLPGRPRRSPPVWGIALIARRARLPLLRRGPEYPGGGARALHRLDRRTAACSAAYSCSPASRRPRDRRHRGGAVTMRLMLVVLFARTLAERSRPGVARAGRSAGLALVCTARHTAHGEPRSGHQSGRARPMATWHERGRRGADVGGTKTTVAVAVGGSVRRARDRPGCGAPARPRARVVGHHRRARAPALGEAGRLDGRRAGRGRGRRRPRARARRAARGAPERGGRHDDRGDHRRGDRARRGVRRRLRASW